MSSNDIDPTITTQLNPTGSASARRSMMPYLAHQYALPIHHGLPRHDNDDVSHRSGEETPRAEYTLRRKTPNGTLNAGYDGHFEYQNPQKHQLLLSEGTIPRPTYAATDNGKRTFLEHQQRRSQSYGGWATPIGSAWPPPPHHPQAISMPVMDSVLNQMPTQLLSAHQYYGQTVPSVIQPSFHHLGPTASGGLATGLYGPYWHDGTFVPYRPTAVKEPRFYHHASHAWSPTVPDPHMLYPPRHWQSSSHVAGNHPWLPAAGAPAHRPYYTGPQASTHTYQSSPSDITSGRAMGALMNSTQSPHANATVDAEYGPSSANGMQRDKMYHWALHQYKELLHFIHQTRKQRNPQFHQAGNQPHRPAFYPRPPKPSSAASKSRLTDHLRTKSDTTPASAVVDSAPSSNAPADSTRADENGGSSRSRPHADSAWSPGGVHMKDNEYQRRASQDQWQRGAENAWPPGSSDPQKPAPTLRRTSGSVVAAIVSQPPLDDSPPSRAALALSYIEMHCQETSWEWIDGIHLGGCLAYGLGSYSKALRWYEKVLDLDPKHLEATSNFAATLLALDRKQEAELHWSKVVKAAPNHFEAVEHLVGLLCNEHRSRDAVSVIEYVECCLRYPKPTDSLKPIDKQSECSSSTASQSPCVSEQSDKIAYDFDVEADHFAPDWRDNPASTEPGFGSSGFAIPGSENGRMLALIHAKGNMLYSLSDNAGASRAFEDAVLVATGRHFTSVLGLIHHILTVVSGTGQPGMPQKLSMDPILLTPLQALKTAQLCFPHTGELPGLQHVYGGLHGIARKAAISTTSNSLLSLAKIYQDGMSNANRAAGITPLPGGVRDILALYYLSLALQASPSTANNVGILLASVQQAPGPISNSDRLDIPGVTPGSGVHLALQYYNYGLQLDQHHAHLYTNLGSLLKDIGQLDAAINMYERAVKCDGRFDIALANLANAVKDKGRIGDAIVYYKRAVEVSPDFAEAVCGLANALNSVCSWTGRGGIAEAGGSRDRWHVRPDGMPVDARKPGVCSSGWIKRVVDIVDKQLLEGERWGCGTLTPALIDELIQTVVLPDGPTADARERERSLRKALTEWAGEKWEGARLVRMVERATRRIGWRWYRDAYVKKRQRTTTGYNRPRLPSSLTMPTAPTVLPFHTFTCPMSAKQIRLISQRNALRISVSALRAPWLPAQVYPPPRPPSPYLKVGYISSDFNNHPLAHLMQSVFGLHDRRRVQAYCYATTASDRSIHREQIEKEAPVFQDVSTYSTEKIVTQIVRDGIHILVNLNGYTRGARNEVFAARAAPIQMSFMGFAGTLGAEWCDYLMADETAIPPSTLRPWRRNIDLEDQLVDENNGGDNEEWVYGENIIYCRDTFFCCDHKQSAPGSHEQRLSWEEEQRERWRMRKELFPKISHDTIIFGNFNQLYKIEPTTFRTWLRILASVPNSILWLLRFPDLGEQHLLSTAQLWGGADVASRVIFTDVAPKHLHISRARVCDLVLDTAECNAHTTAADVLWSGTPLLTLPRYAYKMCSRMAASILKGALPKNAEGRQAADLLVARSEEDYEEKAILLGKSLRYAREDEGRGEGRLMELRRMLFEARWTSALFDTKRWVRDVEDAYEIAWQRYVMGEGGDIWLEQDRPGRQ